MLCKLKEKYELKISNRFAASENLDDSTDIKMNWESIRENIKTSATESVDYYLLKQHELWFGKVCSKLSDQGK
jgi:hypothetical protein